MGIYGTYGAFNGLGKPSIKLEFEDNESLVAFSKKMQDDEPAPVQWNEEEEMFTPVEGYGDKYIVTDLRQRAKKEPGEVKSLTKFQFSKFKNAPELFEPVVSVSPSLFGVYPVFKGVNNDIVYFEKELSDNYNADFILKDYVINKSERLVTLNFARYKAYGTDGVSIVSVWSFSISCPVCNITTAYSSKIDAYFGLIEFAEGLIAVLKNAQSKLRSNSKDYKTLQHQIERWQDAANQYADSLGAPGDTYIITDTRTRARKDLEDTAALKKYDIRKFSGEELQKMQTEDPLLYEQIKSEITTPTPTAILPTQNDNVEIVVDWRHVWSEKEPAYYAHIYFFLPITKKKDGKWDGHDIMRVIKVDASQLHNIKPLPNGKKNWYTAFISKDLFNKLKMSAITNFIDTDIANIERQKREKEDVTPSTGGEKLRRLYDEMIANAKKRIKYLKEYYNITDSLGKTANDALYNNLEILDYRGMQPTYRQLSNYDGFFKPATNKNSLKGWGLNDTKKLIADICRNHYKECAAIAKHLKAETKLQSAFNLWHWLHHNIRYEYDREGREEVRTPSRTWADRHRGVDCDCLSVFVWCVLKCMGYNPAFELAAFRNKPAYSHIYINLDGIVVDRVWYVFNSRPPFITKTELFKVGMLDNLGQLF